MRKAVPKVWSLTIVITPARSRSSSSGSSADDGGAVWVGLGAGVAAGWARRWTAVGIRIASPATTSVMTSSVRSCSFGTRGIRPTVLQRSRGGLSWRRFLGAFLSLAPGGAWCLSLLAPGGAWCLSLLAPGGAWCLSLPLWGRAGWGLL